MTNRRNALLGVVTGSVISLFLLYIIRSIVRASNEDVSIREAFVPEVFFIGTLIGASICLVLVLLIYKLKK